MTVLIAYPIHTISFKYVCACHVVTLGWDAWFGRQYIWGVPEWVCYPCLAILPMHGGWPLTICTHCWHGFDQGNFHPYYRMDATAVDGQSQWRSEVPFFWPWLNSEISHFVSPAWSQGTTGYMCILGLFMQWHTIVWGNRKIVKNQWKVIIAVSARFFKPFLTFIFSNWQAQFPWSLHLPTQNPLPPSVFLPFLCQITPRQTKNNIAIGED